MSLIVAIDVGIRNLALACYDTETEQVTRWFVASLVDGRYQPARNVEYVQRFAAAHAALFERAAVVLIERQMRGNMRILEALLALRFDGVVLSPRSVKARFGLCSGDYRQNKRNAVAWAEAQLARRPHLVCDEARAAFAAAAKRDDLADALLLLAYHLDATGAWTERANKSNVESK